MNSTFMKLVGEWGDGQCYGLNCVSPPPPPANPYVETLTPSAQNVTVFGMLILQLLFLYEREINLLFSGFFVVVVVIMRGI